MSLDAATAGTDANFAEIDLTDGDDDPATNAVGSIEEAVTYTEANTFNGTIMYAFVFDSDDGTDGYLVVDEDLDGTADYGIILTGLITTGDVVTGDIV